MTQEKMVVLFMGAPGSGKGTLSAQCERELGWCQLSTGNLLRKHLIEQSEIGKQIDFIIKSGKLVSDDLINSMVETWLIEAKKSGCVGIILDGYPRTENQAHALTAFLQDKLADFQLKVVRLQIDNQVAADRMLSRLVCGNKACQAVYSAMQGAVAGMQCNKCGSTVGRRGDDHTVTIRERLAAHIKHEQALLDFYKQHGVAVVECNAEQAVEHTFDEFKMLMNIH